MRHRVVCSRGELPALAARGLSAAADVSASLAIAALADIVPVVIPGLRDELGDIDALAIYGRMAFSANLSRDTLALLRSRSIPVMQESAAVLADTWQIQRELEAPESTLCTAGDAMVTICTAAAETALELKKRTDFAYKERSPCSEGCGGSVYFFRCRSRRSTSMSSATVLWPPSGMMTWAYFLLGST